MCVCVYRSAGALFVVLFIPRPLVADVFPACFAVKRVGSPAVMEAGSGFVSQRQVLGLVKSWCTLVAIQ